MLPVNAGEYFNNKQTINEIMQNINELTKDLPDYGPRESLAVEYRIYLECADNGNGKDITTGADLLTFDEWLES